MSGQQSNSDDGFIMLVLMTVLIGGGAWAAWYFFDEQIMDTMRWLRYGEMQLLSLVLGDGYKYLDPVFGQTFELGQIKEWAENALSSEMTTDHIGLFTRFTMHILKWPIAFIMMILMFWSIFRGPGTLYKRVMDLNGLMREQAKSFPVIKPFVDFNPSKQKARVPGSPVPAELPLFAEALSPEEWLAYTNTTMPDGKLDAQSARNAFIEQLGRRWKGLKYLKDYERALFAAFALKSVRKRDEADALLNELALCWTKEGKVKVTSALKSKVEKILHDAKVTKPIYQEACKHAYVKTALLRALQYARSEGGVLASAQFVWLRGHDRGLWYPLNNLGRRSFHAEAMGVMSHFTAEKSMGRAIPMPQVSDAVKGLENYLEAHKPVTIPQLTYKDAKKRSGILKPLSQKG